MLIYMHDFLYVNIAKLPNFLNANSVYLAMALNISLYYTHTFPLSLMSNSQQGSLLNFLPRQDIYIF